MYNPHKETRTCAPYSESTQPIYPSQSIDFIPLHLGGLNTPQYPAPFHGRGRGGVGSRGYHNQAGREFQQRFNRQPNDMDYSGGFGNYNRRPQQYNRGGFQGRFQHQPSQGYNGRQYQQQNKNRHGKKSENRDIFNEYFNKTMLEDPWKELLERHEALNSY